MADKTLVIVESPAKAKTINKFLGTKYQVKSSMGHIIDLPKSKLGVDIAKDFSPQYITIRGKGSLLKEIKDAANKAKNILIATDPDREGEAIAWHLQRALNIPGNEKCRIEFNEITQTAIKKAVQEPRKVDVDRVDAQQARRVLDRLVGYQLSPLLWKKVKKGLSAGRVQSVAVRIICEREEEIDNFIPQEYWSLGAEFLTPGKKSFEAKLIKVGGKKAEIANEEEMQVILKQLDGVDKYPVIKIDKKDKSKNPYAPFTTSSLQQEAVKKLNFTSKKTMQIAQQLYEGIDLGKSGGGTVGLITYIRTDSRRISSEAREEAKAYILDQYGEKYLPDKDRIYASGKSAQDAHEAIRPSSIYRNPADMKESLSRDQMKLYKLIWERFLASQMASAIVESVAVDIQGGEALFRANGSMIKFPGFMKIDKDSETETKEEGRLPEMSEGDDLTLNKLDPKQHFTQPPPRYTEASLVKTLEELGIGRPSTYAPTIDTILKRGYALKDKKQFYSTELGRIVVDLLKDNFQDIVDLKFTASIETKLDEIAEGHLKWQKVIEDFYGPFSKELKEAEEKIGKVELAVEETDVVCEKCGRNMVIKMGRYGKFLACPGFPECRNTKPLFEPTGKKCPKCDGDIVLRKTKTGKNFYGCSNYPECQFTSWDLPVEEKCPKCGGIMARKSKRFGGNLYCLDPVCGYKEEIKKKEKKEKKNDE